MDYIGIYKIISRIDRYAAQEDAKIIIGDYEGAKKYFRCRKQALQYLLQKCRGKRTLLQKYLEKYSDF